MQLDGSGTLTPDLDLAFEIPGTPLETVLDAAESIAPLPALVEPPGTVDARIRLRRRGAGEMTYSARGNVSAARMVLGDPLPPATDVQAEFEIRSSGGLELRLREGLVAGGPLTGTAKLEPLFPPGVLTFDGGVADASFGVVLQGLLGEDARRVVGPVGLDAEMSLDLGRETIDASALGGVLRVSARDVELPGWLLEREIRTKLESRADALGLSLIHI